MIAPLRLTVHGAASTQLLLRVVNLLAQRNLPPRRLDSRMHGEWMTIEVEVDLPDAGQGELLAERLRSFLEVVEVKAVSRELCSA